MPQHGITAAFPKKSFVADKHVCRSKLALLHFGDEAIGLGEGFNKPPVYCSRACARSHQKGDRVPAIPDRRTRKPAVISGTHRGTHSWDPDTESFHYDPPA